jgi:hypothetical protein
MMTAPWNTVRAKETAHALERDAFTSALNVRAASTA